MYICTYLYIYGSSRLSKFRSGSGSDYEHKNTLKCIFLFARRTNTHVKGKNSNKISNKNSNKTYNKISNKNSNKISKNTSNRFSNKTLSNKTSNKFSNKFSKKTLSNKTSNKFSNKFSNKTLSNKNSNYSALAAACFCRNICHFRFSPGKKNRKKNLLKGGSGYIGCWYTRDRCYKTTQVHFVFISAFCLLKFAKKQCPLSH
jgi:hypothetical protein